MKRVFPFLFLLLLGMLCSQPLQAAPSWSGTYRYEEDGGRTAGGTAIFITHELKVWKDPKQGWLAHLQSNGYQTYIDLMATPRLSKNGRRLDFRLLRYQNESMNFWAKKGEILFSLERGRSRRRAIRTVWNKFGPVTLEKAPAPGVFFRRVRK